MVVLALVVVLDGMVAPIDIGSHDDLPRRLLGNQARDRIDHLSRRAMGESIL